MGFPSSCKMPASRGSPGFLVWRRSAMFLKSTLYSHWPLWLGGSHCPLVDATFGKFSVGGKAGVEHLGLMRSAYFVLVVLIPKPITSVSKITKVINSWLPILYYYIPDLFVNRRIVAAPKGVPEISTTTEAKGLYINVSSLTFDDDTICP